MSNNIKNSEIKDAEILVTGGCGFIGSEVTKQLSELGANITIIDNLSSGKEEYIQDFKNTQLVIGDICNENDVKKVVKDKEYVINLAALPFIPDSYNVPMKFFEVNVNAIINLMMAMKNQKTVKRFVHISSSEIYGSARFSPMTENHPTIPQSTYAVSKLAGERVAYTMYKEHNVPTTIIRPFNSFGPNITQPYIIPEIISQLLNGNHILELGNIHSRRDLTFVSDTARGIISSLVSEGVIGETINVGSERSVTIQELVFLLAEIFSRDVKIKIDSSRLRPHDVEALICDYGKAKRLLSWEPTLSIFEGLRKTVEWSKENHIKLKTPFKGWISSYRENFEQTNDKND